MAKATKRIEKSATFSKEHSLIMESSYTTPAITIERGSGCYLFDVDGKRYLDFLSGIATNALGAAHPELISAVTK
ncbi:MAG: aminotransferase class III-fold pyridoxal phosphate-dependent enzyme, partial [Candidatus Nanopelagicaceae bacterium]